MKKQNVKFINYLSPLVIFMITALTIGCGGGSPTTPSGTDPGPSMDMRVNTSENSNRYNWGLWDITLDTENMTSEMVPVRDTQIHYNVLQMLEGWACQDCIRIVNLSYNDADNLEVEIGIRHPYPTDRLDLTGRDVRGVAIFPASLSFPNHTVRNKKEWDVPLYASDILVNADGWTTHFNRETAYEGTGLWQYKKGKMTFPDENTIQGNLHGYKDFYTHTYKRLFYPGYEVIETYELAIPFQGKFTFAYSVDASWSLPLEWPVNNPVTDFSLSAGAREPFQISMTIDSSDMTQQGGSANLIFDIFDHQGYDSISVISIEAPDLWDGVKYIDHSAPDWSDEEMARYTWNCPNETGYAQIENGGSELLIVVEDVAMSIVGEDVKAYNIFRIPAEDVPKTWRSRGDWFQNVSLFGMGPTNNKYDITVIANPLEPWAFEPGETMVLFANDNTETYIAWNRDFDDSKHLAGFPGNPNSWIQDTQRIDATFNGALGVTSNSDEVVDGQYLVRNCTNMHQEGAIYTTSWYTGSLDDPTAYLEVASDVSGGYGLAAGDPLYSLYLFDTMVPGLDPGYSSIHRIAAPYNDPYEVQRALLPSEGALNGVGGPFGISEKFFVAMGIDDEPFNEANPYVAHVYVGENQETGPTMNTDEVDIFRVNFAATSEVEHVKTYNDAMLGSSYIGPIIGKPELIDIDTLPALHNEVYMGAGIYAKHNWMVVLFNVAPNQWFIEIFDPLAEDATANDPIFLIGPYEGNAVAMDIDPVNFEIYVLHDDLPSGLGQMHVTCLEYH